MTANFLLRLIAVMTVLLLCSCSEQSQDSNNQTKGLTMDAQSDDKAEQLFQLQFEKGLRGTRKLGRIKLLEPDWYYYPNGDLSRSQEEKDAILDIINNSQISQKTKRDRIKDMLIEKGTTRIIQEPAKINVKTKFGKVNFLINGLYIRSKPIPNGSGGVSKTISFDGKLPLFPDENLSVYIYAEPESGNQKLEGTIIMRKDTVKIEQAKIESPFRFKRSIAYKEFGIKPADFDAPISADKK